MNTTELLGFQIAFSLPNWFPPESAEYKVNHADYTSTYGNRAVDELSNLQNVDTVAVHQICGNWITFKFEDISVTEVTKRTSECREALHEFIKRWSKPVDGHEYLIQSGSGEFDVLDLSDATIAWSDASYELCQKWIDSDNSAL